MPLSADDDRWLKQSLALAVEAAAYASPNPTVGCVLVREGVVLGRGAHFYDRRDHAEVAALRQAAEAGHATAGATAYVTLEPCAHHGRTGPCADALVAAGITRVVVATVDPNPLVRGTGIATLRGAGVEVAVAEPGADVAARARRLNDAFAHWIQRGRPFVTLKAALSVDGMLAPAPTERSAREPHWLTGAAARADVQQLRHAADAIVTGIGTVLADNPALTDRTGEGRRRPLRRCIVDSKLRTPPDARALAGGEVTIFCGEQTSAASAERMENSGARVVRLPTTEGRLDLAAMLGVLGQQGEISVLVEAGSGLNGALLSAGLVDKVVLYYAETELGPGAVAFAAGAGSPYALQARLSAVSRESFAHGSGEDVRLSGYVSDPWAGLDG